MKMEIRGSVNITLAKRMILFGALVGENPYSSLDSLVSANWDLSLSWHCVQDLLQVQMPWEGS